MKRTHLEPIPKGGVGPTLQIVRRAIVQPGVQEVRISTRGVEVVREMGDDDGDVLPRGSDDVDIDFLLEKLDLAMHPYREDEHGTAALFAACEAIHARKLFPRWILLPGWPLVAAWLGVEAKSAPRTLYGLQTHFVQSAQVNGRAVLLGSPEHYYHLSDAVAGITIDLGV